MARLPPHAVLLADWGEVMTMRYFVHAERLRPDVAVVLSEGAVQRTEQRAAAARLGRPCWTTVAGNGEKEAGRWARGALYILP